MLRFSSLNKVCLALKGRFPYGFPGRSFSDVNPEFEGVPEKTEEGAEEEILEEDPEEIEPEEKQKKVYEKKLVPHIFRKVYLDEREALQVVLSEYDSFRKSSNYGPFSFNKRIGDNIDEQLSKLHKETFDSLDISKETKTKISHLISDSSDPNAIDPTNIYQKIEDLIHRSFTRGDYDIIYDRDFRNLIFKKSYLPFLHLFLKKEFLLSNPHIFSEIDLQQSLRLILKDQSFFPLLKFQPFVTPSRSDKVPSLGSHLKLAEDFLQAFENSNQFNYLAFVHYYFNLSKGGFLDSINFTVFTERMLNIYWGTPNLKADKQRFIGHLYDMLMIKLNLEENQTLKYYLADMFLTAPTYDNGLKILGNTLLILNRLLNNSVECNDLYYTFIQRMGEEKFNFYIKESLPTVLTLIRKKKLASLCKKSLQAFQGQSIKSPSEIKPVILDIFDQNFYQKNSKIYCAYEGNTEIDFLNEFSYYPERKKEEQPVEDELKLLRKAMITQDPNDFVKMFYEECQRDLVSREIFRKVSSKYTGNPESFEELSTNQAFKLLDNLVQELETEFIPNAVSEKYTSKILFKTKRYNPSFKESPRIGLKAPTPHKGFSTFISNKRSDMSNSLNYKIVSNFGTEDSKTSSSPFKDFLRKAEEIDQVVKNQQLSQEEANKMKKSLFEKKKEKESQGIKFSKIEDGLISQTAQRDIVQKEANFIFTQDYWDKIVGVRSEIPYLLSRVEDHFLKFEDIFKAQNAIENFIESEPLSTKGLTSHKMAFFKMFYQPCINKLTPEELENLNIQFKESQIEVQASDKLQLNFNTNLGEVEKDYNKYLTSTLFHYSIGEKGYKTLLETLETDYKRKYFKKLIAHIARFSTDISNENLSLIANICYEQKIAFTLVETAQLFIQNGVINRPDQLAIIVEKLRFFKDLADSSEYLAKAFVQYSGIPFSIDLMGSHLDLLMKYGKYEKFMPIFDRLKETVGNQKFTYKSDLSAEENFKLQEKFKANNKEVLSQLYRDFIQKLNEYKIYNFAQLLYKEQRELKLTLTQQDYINAIFLNKENIQDLESILKAVCEFNDSKFAFKAVLVFLDTIAENPKELKSLITNILEELVYTHKIELTTGLASKFGSVMAKTSDTSYLSKFIEFLIAEGPQLKYSLKISLLRLLNSSDDQLMKPHNLGQIEKLFSKEQQNKARNREHAKKQAAKEAVGKQETQTLESEAGSKVQAQEVKAEKPKEETSSKESKKQKKSKKGAVMKKEEEQEQEQEETSEFEAKEGKLKSEPFLGPPGERTKFMIRKKSAFDPVVSKYKKQGGVRFRRMSYREEENERELAGMTQEESL